VRVELQAKMERTEISDIFINKPFMSLTLLFVKF